MRDEEILAIAAECESAWVGVDGCTPLAKDDEEAKYILRLVRALLPREEGKGCSPWPTQEVPEALKHKDSEHD